MNEIRIYMQPGDSRVPGKRLAGNSLRLGHLPAGRTAFPEGSPPDPRTSPEFPDLSESGLLRHENICQPLYPERRRIRCEAAERPSPQGDRKWNRPTGPGCPLYGIHDQQPEHHVHGFLDFRPFPDSLQGIPGDRGRTNPKKIGRESEPDHPVHPATLAAIGSPLGNRQAGRYSCTTI